MCAPEAKCVTLLLALVLTGCLSDPAVPTAVGDLTTAEIDAIMLDHSPLPPRPSDPTNRWADNPRAIAFGRALFYDTRLSPSGAFSCASCHDPDKSFTDRRRFAVGVGTAARHTPTLWNVAWQRWYSGMGARTASGHRPFSPLRTLSKWAVTATSSRPPFTKPRICAASMKRSSARCHR
ncbi:MAG: hypothetical protein D6761_02625 [Candidatus Dadabacteria bacterium]|nr:MAG: hypothetical protein D6761_02625 [Candidatus Dadabacteria bacterium]